MLGDVGLDRVQFDARQLEGQIGRYGLRRDFAIQRQRALFIDAGIERHTDRLAQVLACPIHLQRQRRQDHLHGRVSGAILQR